ncbi:hypothetical protein OFQ64_12430 [Brachyspira hyodysenteriae]|uniref:hypothetical protein n=1 Tax=Brachyspira hyodysenteriae TaxID=159 RepID=UPI0022CDBAC6|nr:hypothetical protein [Brachyspira hyodysenteriae]MCZ9979534.1 hypothetical protein [Brachyspira hyodysenteriae]
MYKHDRTFSFILIKIKSIIIGFRFFYIDEYGNKYKNEVPLLIPLFESNRENIEEAVKSALNIVIQKANNK